MTFILGRKTYLAVGPKTYRVLSTASLGTRSTQDLVTHAKLPSGKIARAYICREGFLVVTTRKGFTNFCRTELGDFGIQALHFIDKKAGERI